MADAVLARMFAVSAHVCRIGWLLQGWIHRAQGPLSEMVYFGPGRVGPGRVPAVVG